MRLRFRITMMTRTIPERPRFWRLAKVPSAMAAKPPAMVIMPTLTSVKPMSVTTMPVTVGVMILRACPRKRLRIISIGEPSRQTPKITPRAPVAGMPPSIKWTLPKGVTAGPLEWPVPHVLKMAGLTMFGYDDELLLAAELTLPKGLKTLHIEAEVMWLAGADV